MLQKCIVETFGNLAKQRKCFSNRTEYYVEYPISGQLECFIMNMETYGYKLFSSRTVAKNKYFVYTSEQETVYVCYAFKLGAIRIFVQDGTPYVGYKDLCTVRTAGLTLMNMKYDDPCQVSHDNGLGLIVSLADGSFIVYDGGYEVDAEGLLRFLEDNSHCGEKPVIRAWVLTHTHRDHYSCFDFFVRNYFDKADIQNVIACIVPDEAYVNGKVEDRYFNDVLPELAHSKGIPIVFPISGQIYEFSGVRMEVLHTAEDLYPLPVATENHSSTMTRLYFEAQDKTVLIPGDLGRSSVTFAVSTWGDYLKSDIMQVPHHGHSGATKEFYYTVNPQSVLFATTNEHYKCRIQSNEAWNHYLMNNLNVSEAIVADCGYQKIL